MAATDAVSTAAVTPGRVTAREAEAALSKAAAPDAELSALAKASALVAPLKPSKITATVNRAEEAARGAARDRSPIPSCSCCRSRRTCDEAASVLVSPL